MLRIRVLLALVVVMVWGVTTNAQPQPFVFKHSFQGPYPSPSIPFWSIGAGAAVENGDRIRLTPARQSRTGYIWNNVPVSCITLQRSGWDIRWVFAVHC